MISQNALMCAHRQATVLALIQGAMHASEIKQCALAFYDDRKGDHNGFDQGTTCIATHMFFPGNLSAQCTVSNYGALWMGLWLDCQVLLHDGESSESIMIAAKALTAAIGRGQIPETEGYHGNTLFPRWLAEVLNEYCGLEIKEEDIYDL